MIKTLCLLLAGLFCFAAAWPSVTASAQLARTGYFQEDILRVAPDDSAAFVPIVKPPGGPPKVEVLSRRGAREEVRLSYRFKYNGSADPNICMMSLFEGTFTGFRKAAGGGAGEK